MRFTPVTFFGQGLTEPCVDIVTAQGAVSQSISIGEVNWDVYTYSSSVYQGGGGSEAFTFEINDYTRNAIVVVVGGGGSTSSDNRGGGGGAVVYEENVLLKPDTTYSITVGEGGTGTNRVTPGTAFSGDSGQQSRFLGGGLDIQAGGGQGGTLSGNGGNSGNGNTSNGTGGAGAGANNEGDWGGPGKQVNLGIRRVSNDVVTLFRAGGGAGDGGDISGQTFGAGGLVASEAGGSPNDGEDNRFTDDTLTFGGGSGGGQFFNVTESRYKSMGAASGCVMIAFPTNLCTSSLYTVKNIETSGLLAYYDVSNPRTFGKRGASNTLTDVYRMNSLTHETTREPISSNTGSLLFFQASGSSSDVNAFNIDSEKIWLNEPLRVQFSLKFQDYLSGSVNYDITSGFSIDVVVEPETTFTDTTTLFNISGSESAYIALRYPPSGNTFVRYYDGVTNNDTSGFASGTNKQQHVVTYDGNDIRWYVDTVLKDTLTVGALTSSLSAPDLFFGLDQLGRVQGEGYQIYDARLYSTTLSTGSIEQNYSASFGL